MNIQRRTRLRLWGVLIVGLGLSLLSACGSDSAGSTVSSDINTWLLVKAPDKPLAAGRPVNVKSRSEDADGISHVELYVVELQPADTAKNQVRNVLIRSDAAPFDQTVYTANQSFTPTERGHYVIKVVGYDKAGQSDESDYISFMVQ